MNNALSGYILELLIIRDWELRSAAYAMIAL